MHVYKEQNNIDGDRVSAILHEKATAKCYSKDVRTSYILIANLLYNDNYNIVVRVVVLQKPQN